MKKYAICLISARYNFIAEPAIERLPLDVDLFVIHTHKDDAYKRRFKVNRTYKEIGNFEDGPTHPVVLNRITFERRFADLEPYQWIVMMDHDAYFNNPRDLKNWLDNTCDNSQYLLRCFHRPKGWRQLFFTFPIMLINHSIKWQDQGLEHDWSISIDPWNDTGQLLGEEMLNKGLFHHLYTNSFIDYQHIGSAWMGSLLDPITKGVSSRVFLSLLRQGVLKPTSCDLNRMIMANEDKRFALIIENEVFKLIKTS